MNNGGDDFDIFEEWDLDGFFEMVKEACEEDDYEIDILEILETIQHTDADKESVHP